MNHLNHNSDTRFAQEAEFMRLLNENKARIMRLCAVYAASREDREDLFQEITIQIWKSFGSFRGESQISTWLYRIALNVAMRFASRSKRQREHITRVEWIEELPLVHAEHDAATQERIEQLQHCIAALPEADRSLMVLYLEECSYKEIAAITGLSESNVGVKLNRLKSKL
jgi:RNA polymerase sigma factor (sigma-70 family)